jgi:hypothetical protein
MRPLLLGVLDDRSRLTCHVQWYLEETAECLVHGLCQVFQGGGDLLEATERVVAFVVGAVTRVLVELARRRSRRGEIVDHGQTSDHPLVVRARLRPAVAPGLLGVLFDGGLVVHRRVVDRRVRAAAVVDAVEEARWPDRALPGAHEVHAVRPEVRGLVQYPRQGRQETGIRFPWAQVHVRVAQTGDPRPRGHRI